MLATQEELDTRQALAAQQCEGPSSDSCQFINSPVKLQNDSVRIGSRLADFYPTAERLEFVDVAQRRWVAPERTLTDGASIPRIFVPIVGSPRSQEFVNAAAIHDAYCGIGNEQLPEYHSAPWQDVHRMFYDALRVGGTEAGRAKVMFAAVYLGGPRWNSPPERLDMVPDAYLRDAMIKTQTYIGENDPTMPELLAYLKWLERRLIKKWVPANEDGDNNSRNGRAGTGRDAQDGGTDNGAGIAGGEIIDGPARQDGGTLALTGANSADGLVTSTDVTRAAR